MNGNIDVRDSLRSPLTLVIYAGEMDTNGQRLVNLISASLPGHDMQICADAEALRAHLVRSPYDSVIVILSLSSRGDLEGLLAHSLLLYDFRIIAILPDRSDDTVVLGHSLRPRFITYQDSDFSDVKAVLGRMLRGRSPP